MGDKQSAVIIAFKPKPYFRSRMHKDLSIGGAKLSYRKEKIVLGENFFDLLSKFFYSPKRDFSLAYSEKVLALTL